MWDIFVCFYPYISIEKWIMSPLSPNRTIHRQFRYTLVKGLWLNSGFLVLTLCDKCPLFPSVSFVQTVYTTSVNQSFKQSIKHSIQPSLWHIPCSLLCEIVHWYSLWHSPYNLLCEIVDSLWNSSCNLPCETVHTASFVTVYSTFFETVCPTLKK